MLIIFFILGLMFGSFINVIVYRLDLAENFVFGRSKCPHCKAKIRWYDNIPALSFLLLKARCRDCQRKISWQYPGIEILTGIVFALTGYYFFSLADFSSWAETLMYLGAFSLMLVIFAYDLKFMEIPMAVFWIAAGWVVAFFLALDLMNFNPAAGIFSVRIFSGMMAGMVGFLFFYALSAGSKEKWMGIGDAYLAFLSGLLVGIQGLLYLIFLSSFIGALGGICLVLLGKKKMKSKIPFAPFLVVAVWLVIFVPKIFPAIKYWIIY